MNDFKRVEAQVSVTVEICLPDYLDLSDLNILEQMTRCGFPTDNEVDAYKHVVDLLLNGGEGSNYDVFGWVMADWMPKAETKIRNLNIDIDDCKILNV